MSETAGLVVGGVFLAWFALLCILGAVCTRRDARVPPREASRDFHRPARAYARGEVIKPWPKS